MNDIVLDVLDEIAKARNGNYASTRDYTKRRDHIGLAGEITLGDRYGLPVRLVDMPEGDGGIDFTVPLLFTIDVKTTPASNPGHLLVEENQVVADIYVAARYKTCATDAELIGWEWASAVRAAEVRPWNGVPHHQMVMLTRDEGGKLRPMSELDKRMAVLRPFFAKQE
jgi:hypothetical protein